LGGAGSGVGGTALALPGTTTPGAPSLMLAGSVCLVSGCASAVTAALCGEFGANTPK